MAIEYIVPVDLPVAYYRPIGEIINRCALMELYLRHISWRCLEIDNKRGRILTVGMDANVLIGIVKNLANKWSGDPTTAQKIHSIANEARGYFRQRNAIAHGFWGYPKGKIRRGFKFHEMFEASQRELPRAVTKTPKHLKELAAKLRRLNAKADELVEFLDEKARQKGSA